MEKLIGRPVAASCLGRIPVYRPKGISLSRSLSHSLTLLLTCLLLARLVTLLSQERHGWRPVLPDEQEEARSRRDHQQPR